MFFLALSSIVAQQGHKKGELIFKLKPEVDSKYVVTTLNKTNPKLGLELIEELSEMGRLFYGSFNPLNNDLNTAIQIMEQSGFVEFAQPNHINIEKRSVPNDNNYPAQWYLDRINAPSAWDWTTGGRTINGDEIVVAVVDVSFELTHSDLKDNFWKNKHEIPNNGIDDDNNGYIDDYDGWNAYDDTGYVSVYSSGTRSDAHGTYVAGVLGAKGNNGVDITGINWDIKMMPVQGNSTNEAIVLKAYNYILTMRKKYNETNGDSGAFVVAQNSSFGVDNAFAKDYPAWCSMYDLLGKEGVVSVAAGPNNKINIDSVGDIPCSCPSDYLISVTRTDENDRLFKGGFGLTSMDIAAPGTRIYSTRPVNSAGFNEGTSYATPMVTGAIGLMYSAYPSSFFSSSADTMALRSVEYARNSVQKTAELDTLIVSGGILDLEKAVSTALDAPPLSANENEVLRTGVKLYPNPSNGYIKFERELNGTFKLFDISGKEVLSSTEFLKFNSLDASSLNDGMYLLKIVEKGNTTLQKVIIRK